MKNIESTDRMNENVSVSWNSSMPKRKTQEELTEYNRRIKEAFEKHGLVPKTVYKKGWKAIFPGNSEQKEEK